MIMISALGGMALRIDVDAVVFFPLSRSSFLRFFVIVVVGAVAAMTPHTRSRRRLSRTPSGGQWSVI